jgi:cysteine desulfurase
MTPVDPLVVKVMLPAFAEDFGSPSRVQHAAGQAAAEPIELAEESIAQLVGRRARNVVFTGGSTEAANIAIHCYMGCAPDGRNRIVASATEHKTVLASAQSAARSVRGRVDLVRVDSRGQLDLDRLAQLLRRDVAIVAVMLANNEMGALFDADSICEPLRDSRAVLFCDATQAPGKFPVGLPSSSNDLAIFSAHDLHSSKGPGAFVRSAYLDNDGLDELVSSRVSTVVLIMTTGDWQQPAGRKSTVSSIRRDVDQGLRDPQSAFRYVLGLIIRNLMDLGLISGREVA